MGEKTGFSGKITILDLFDDAVFSLALQDLFPRVVFYRRCEWRPKPDNKISHSIPECRDSHVGILFPDDQWEPSVFCEVRGRYKGYRLGNSTIPAIQYRRSEWRCWSSYSSNWSFDFPYPEHGQMDILYRPDNPEDRAIVRKIWKAFRVVATNRIKSGLNRNDYIPMKEAGGGYVWAGVHALQWCSRGERHMLDGNFVPCDDWAWPENPYLNELRDRVIARFGPDFGREPPDPEKATKSDLVDDSDW